MSAISKVWNVTVVSSYVILSRRPSPIANITRRKMLKVSHSLQQNCTFGGATLTRVANLDLLVCQPVHHVVHRDGSPSASSPRHEGQQLRTEAERFSDSKHGVPFQCVNGWRGLNASVHGENLREVFYCRNTEGVTFTTVGQTSADYAFLLRHVKTHGCVRSCIIATYRKAKV